MIATAAKEPPFRHECLRRAVEDHGRTLPGIRIATLCLLRATSLRRLRGGAWAGTVLPTVKRATRRAATDGSRCAVYSNHRPFN